MQKLNIILFFTLSTNLLCAQGELETSTGVGAILNERYFNIGFRTNGLSLTYDFQKMKSTTWRTHQQVAFNYYRSPKEVSLTNPIDYNARRFVYGKTNSFFSFSYLYGKTKRIYSKKDKGGIEIRANLGIGGELGILKPIYYFNSYDRSNSVRFDSGNQPDITYIYGRDFFTKGFSEISINPGLITEASAQFEYAQQSFKIRIIETGIRVSLFPKNIQIMESDSHNFYFASFFISTGFGRAYSPRIKKIKQE